MTPRSASAVGRAGRREREDPPIRLMIVDDSAIARTVLSRMISTQRGFEVAVLAGSAREALDQLATTPVDIVLLDVEMPGTTGLAALPEILRKGNGARVVILSSLCEEGAEVTVRALALGAADTLPKPGTGTFGGRFSEVLGERLRRIGRAQVQPNASRGHPNSEFLPISLRALPAVPFGCLSLGASTGGLHALGDFLRGLPPVIGVPILVTQHLPTAFMPSFTRQIELASGRVSTVAEDGAPLIAEQILVAPGDAHIGLERIGSRVLIKLNEAPASSGCMPSVDSMFWAVSEVYRHMGLGIVFSGMGRDGLVGSARLVDRGGAVLVQDEPTSAVWGMPRAVAEAGLASAVLPPCELARLVSEWVENGSRR